MAPPVKSTSHDWQLLTRKFGKNPYFMFSPVIEQDFAGVLFKSAKHKVIAQAVVFIAFGAAAILLPLYFRIGLLATSTLIPFGSLFVLAGLYATLRCRQILFDRRSKDISISYGFHPFVSHVRLPTHDLLIQLSVNTANTTAVKPGQTCIDLCFSDPAQPRMRLRASQNKAKLLTAYEQLSGLLGGQAVDQSIIRLKLADGREIEVSKAPILNTASGGFRSARLVFQTADVAAIIPTIRTRLFFFGFFAAGIVTLVISIGSLFNIDLLGIFLGGIIGVVFVLVGFLGMTGRLVMKSMIFDRQHGRMYKKGQKSSVFSGAVGTGLADVAALQICSHYEPESDGPGYLSYQFNIVLAGPPGQRINLMDHTARSALMEDAKRLAEFLSVPLLDHT